MTSSTQDNTVGQDGFKEKVCCILDLPEDAPNGEVLERVLKLKTAVPEDGKVSETVECLKNNQKTTKGYFKASYTKIFWHSKSFTATATNWG
jgi:hypothetical protein